MYPRGTCSFPFQRLSKRYQVAGIITFCFLTPSPLSLMNSRLQSYARDSFCFPMKNIVLRPSSFYGCRNVSGNTHEVLTLFLYSYGTPFSTLPSPTPSTYLAGARLSFLPMVLTKSLPWFLGMRFCEVEVLLHRKKKIKNVFSTVRIEIKFLYRSGSKISKPVKPDQFSSNLFQGLDRTPFPLQ